MDEFSKLHFKRKYNETLSNEHRLAAWARAVGAQTEGGGWGLSPGWRDRDNASSPSPRPMDSCPLRASQKCCGDLSAGWLSHLIAGESVPVLRAQCVNVCSVSFFVFIICPEEWSRVTFSCQFSLDFILAMNDLIFKFSLVWRMLCLTHHHCWCDGQSAWFADGSVLKAKRTD